MSEELEKDVTAVEETQTQENSPMSFDDGVIKVNLGELNKPTEDAVQGETIDSVQDAGEESAGSGENTEVEVPQPEQAEEPAVLSEEQPVLQEITEEEAQEQAEDLKEEIEQAVVESEETGVDLPENIQKVVEFMNETGGSLEDYVKLNTDYSQLSQNQLLREYYENTKPHLDKEDIDILMEDFSYDEELDEERDVRKAKIAFKDEVAKAKNHLEGLKTKYYEEIKAGSKLAPEQQKAVDFFNRYKKENEEATKLVEKQVATFNSKTESLFSNDFKGFDFNVGEKKFRFNVNDVAKVKSSQSDINNFVKKFLNDNNEMSDAKGYHKSLFTAMNADKIASHFYEQGKADAIKNSISKAKNVDMDPRGAHEEVTASNGWKVKSISGGQSSSKLRIKNTRK